MIQVIKSRGLGFVLSILFFFVSGFSTGLAPFTAWAEAPSATTSETKIKAPKVALIFDLGGKDDQSFNSAAWRGASKAISELNAQVKSVEPSDHDAFERYLRSFAGKKFDLIIAIGVAQASALEKIAKRFKHQKFAIIDAQVNAPNVKSFIFRDNEGSFVVGAIAALVSKTGKVGFIGGIDIPLVRGFSSGYIAGAKAVKPEAEVFLNFIGTTGESWNNPTKAKELALSQYGRGVEVIYSVAGASGTGVFDAAEEQKKFAIGVDSNQNGVKPGFVLTSMIKRVDLAVFNVCKELANGKFVPGLVKMDLANQGVDYTVDSYNEKILPQEVRQKADQLKADIVAGKIKMPKQI